MIKTEKVIKGLERRLECGCMNEDYCNSNCPYLGDPRACYGLDEDALTLLKAQMPEVMDAPKPDNDIGCWYDITHNYTLEQVVSALKTRESRVMTLGDLRDIGSVWELNTPPYLWMEIIPTYRWTRGFWVAWCEIYDMIDGLHPTYDADNYLKIWRCWTSRPSDELREATPWNAQK